jgi:hypothetical protein
MKMLIYKMHKCYNKNPKFIKIRSKKTFSNSSRIIMIIFLLHINYLYQNIVLFQFKQSLVDTIV